VMNAASKFKRLIAHKHQEYLQGMFDKAPIVQPPGLIEQRHVARSLSDNTDQRNSMEGSLAAEGVHRDIQIKDNLSRAETREKTITGQNEDVRVTGHSQWSSAQTQASEDHSPSNSGTPVGDDPAGTVSPRSETGKGQAHDPLEDTLFLAIGSSAEDPKPGPDDPPIVSESPGAVDINVYEQAYEEEIQRILAAKSQQRPTLYLTARVEKVKRLREHHAIVDFSRAATTVSAALGLTKLADIAKSHVEAERLKLVESLEEPLGGQREKETSTAAGADADAANDADANASKD